MAHLPTIQKQTGLNMYKKTFSALLMIIFSISLTGCMNLGHLNYKQARMLKKEGFVLNNEGWTLALPERLLFNFDDYRIQNHQKEKLTELSHQLQKYDLEKLKFTGHTDNIGQATYNYQLSQKRAQSVADVFFAEGFKTQNVQIIGRGSDQPIASNDSEENRAKNRRVNIIIIP